MDEVVVRCLHSLITVHACDGNFFVLNYLFKLGGGEIASRRDFPKPRAQSCFLALANLRARKPTNLNEVYISAKSGKIFSQNYVRSLFISAESVWSKCNLLRDDNILTLCGLEKIASLCYQFL